MIKKSQSQIISTVLLILLIFISILVVYKFAIPFVKDNLSGKDCVKVISKVNMENNLKYTCYDSSLKKIRIGVHIGDIYDLIEGFKIEIGEKGSSRIVKITSYDHDSVESLYGGLDITKFDEKHGGGTNGIPGNDEMRVYVIGNLNDKPEYLRIYPILKNGKTCDSPSDSRVKVSIPECI